MLTTQPPLEWYKYATLTSEVEGAKGLQYNCDASDVWLGHSHGGRCGGDGGGGEPRSPRVAHLLVHRVMYSIFSRPSTGKGRWYMYTMYMYVLYCMWDKQSACTCTYID